MSDMETVTSVPEIDEEELTREMEAAQAAEIGEEPAPEPEAEADAGQSEAEPQPEEGEKEPLSADEWKARHDNLQKALKAERAKRKEGDEYRQKFSEIEQRLSQLTPQERQDVKDEAQARPDASKDPLGALDYALNKITEYEELEARRAQEKEQREQQQAQIQQITSYGAQAEEEFRKVAPDYDEASQHYAQSRVRELQVVYGLDDYAARQQLNQELMAAIYQSAQSGRNPAEAIYEAAKARGYVKKASEAEAKLEQMKEGRKSSPTMPQGGKGKPNSISLDEMLKADPEEFDRLFREGEKMGAFNR